MEDTKLVTEPHEALKIVTPDTVAECWDGVSDDLYKKLWDCVKQYDTQHLENIEDMGPHDVIGINSVAQFWKEFSPEHQKRLNELALEQDMIYLDITEKVAVDPTNNIYEN